MTDSIPVLKIHFLTASMSDFSVILKIPFSSISCLCLQPFPFPSPGSPFLLWSAEVQLFQQCPVPKETQCYPFPKFHFQRLLPRAGDGADRS